MRRAGFTLLEMLLATFVSVLLMGALYVAMDVQLRYAQAGREAIERDTLARALFGRITKDIKQCVTPVAPTPPPPSLKLSTAGSTPAAGSANTAPASSSTTPSNATSTTNPTSSSTPSSSSGTSSSATVRDTIQFNLGVQGGPTNLTLYVSRLPTELDKSRTEALSDLRLISYWLATDGTRPLGLARQELKRVTSDEANAALALPSQLLADEVKILQFRYFDGDKWYESWDGTEPGLDGITAMGPPALIEITLGMLVPSGDHQSAGQPSLKYYRHAVAITTADGVPQ